MQYLDKIKAVKEERNITNAEIAKLSNLPLPTITRIFNGSTPNPTFETLAQIAIALGVSLDEIAGLKTSEAPPIATPAATTLDSYLELLKEKDDRIKELKEEKEKERKEKYKLAFVLACFIAFVLIFLIVDVLNGHFGYFRY